MSGQAQQEHNEEMVRIPEHLKVRASYELQRGGHHEEEGNRDDVAGDASCRHKANGDRVLCKWKALTSKAFS